MPQGAGAEPELTNETHTNAIVRDEGPDIVPDGADAQHEELALHAPIAGAGGDRAPVGAPEGDVGSEGESSEPGRNAVSCFDYSAVDHGGIDATKNASFEPLDAETVEPPDAA